MRPIRTSQRRQPARSVPHRLRPAWPMPAPRIRLPPSRPLPCRPSSPPTAVRDILPAQGAGSAVLKRPHSRRRQHFRRPRLPLRWNRDLRHPQRSLRSVLRRRSLRPHQPRPPACSSHRPSRCGDPTRATDRAAHPAIGPAARSLRMRLRRQLRRPCAPLPTKSRRARFSSDKQVVVQVHAWICARTYAVPSGSST